jgi:RNA polymerase sigma-70 factor (ECF subfamily)
MFTQEKKLIKQLKNGRDEAYQYLFDKYYFSLYRMAIFYVSDEFLAENIVEDCFIYIWKKREELEIHSSLEGYLFTTLRHISLNYLKKASKNPETNFSVFTEGGSDIEYPSNEFSILKKLVAQELDEKIDKCIASLPDACRQVFYLSRFENLTYKEISERQGISVNTVRYHIKNALAFLRKEIEEFMD